MQALNPETIKANNINVLIYHFFFFLVPGNTLYAVNGPTSPMIPVRGFIMDPNSETVFGHWAPTSGVNITFIYFIL